MGNDEEAKRAVEHDSDRFNREHHRRHHPAGIAGAEVAQGSVAKAESVDAAHARDQAFDELRRLIRDRQRVFELQLAQVLYRTQVFGEAVANAFGQVSRNEAIDAIKRFVGEELERLR